jgi:hypothetical protein
MAMARRGGKRVSNRDPEYEDRMELAPRDLADLTSKRLRWPTSLKVSESPKILGDLTLHHRLPTARTVSV